MKKTDPPVIVEETFDAPVEAVWQAITDVARMRAWYFDNIPAFKPEVGFETRFNVRNEGRDFLHVWKVTEASPPQKIAYDWTFEGYPGHGLVVFELWSREGGTGLRLTNHVLEDFPEEVPEFRRESCLAGWEYFIGKRLKAYLDGRAS